MRVGNKQLEWLIVLASPNCRRVSVDPMMASMIKRGLLRDYAPRKGRIGGIGITSAGLRRLADEMDAGRVDEAIDRMAAEFEELQRDLAEKRDRRAQRLVLRAEERARRHAAA